jgi:apolipoprotein N-acyltransferase
MTRPKLSRAQVLAPVPAQPAALAESRVIAWPLLLAPAVSGALIGGSFLDFSLYPLAWVAFAPLFWALARARDRRETIVVAAIAGVVTNILGFYWLVYTINVFGGFPYALSVFFFACLTAYSSLQFVLLGLGVHRLGWGPLALSPALLWTMLEFLYPNLFPWRMGHTQHHVIPLMQIGEATGPYGLSLVVVWMSAALAQTVGGSGGLGWRRMAPLASALVAAAALYGYGVVRIPAIEAAMQAAPRVSIALVQGNIGIKEKGNQRYFDINVEKYRQLTAAVQERAQLAVWPETVIQEWVPAEATVLPDEAHPFPDLRTHLIYGGLAYHRTGPRAADEYNSAFLIGPFGAVLGRYDKQILMPFGEYIPFASLIPGLQELSPNTGGFTAGRAARVFEVPGVGKVGPLICFEDLPASIPRAMTRAGAQLLIAMANDAWYGESAAPYEHQALALWRAVENRRYLLRVNNSGVTGIIDPLGRVVDTLPIFTPGTLIADVQPLAITSVYNRIGDAFGWVVVLVTTGFLAAWRSVRAH